MSVSFRAILAVVLVVGLIAGVVALFKFVGSSEHCVDLVMEGCDGSESAACRDLRRRVNTADLKKRDHDLCRAFKDDPLFKASLERARTGAPGATPVLPYESAWLELSDKREGFCAELAARLADEGYGKRAAALVANTKDIVRCEAGLNNRDERQALVEELLEDVLATRYDGKEPCEELMARARMARPGWKAAADFRRASFLTIERCRATLTADGVRAWIAGGGALDALVTVQPKPEAFPWLAKGEAALEDAVERACRRMVRKRSFLSDEIRRRCERGVIALNANDDTRRRFVVSEINWIAPNLVEMSADPLAADTPWAEGKITKGKTGRLAGDCGTVVTRVCADNQLAKDDPLCQHLTAGFYDVDSCKDLDVDALIALGLSAGHRLSERAKRKVRFRATNVLDPIVRSRTDEKVFHVLVKGDTAKQKKSIDRGLKAARVQGKLSGAGTLSARSRKGLIVDIERLGDVEGGGVYRVIEQRYTPPKKVKKRRRRRRR